MLGVIDIRLFITYLSCLPPRREIASLRHDSMLCFPSKRRPAAKLVSGAPSPIQSLLDCSIENSDLESELDSRSRLACPPISNS